MVDTFTVVVRVEVTSGAEVWSALRDVERVARSVTPGDFGAPPRWHASDGTRSVKRRDLIALREASEQHRLNPTSIDVLMRRREPAGRWVLRGWVSDSTSAFEASAQITTRDRREVERVSRLLAVELERYGLLPAIGTLRVSSREDPDEDAGGGPERDPVPDADESMVVADGVEIDDDPAEWVIEDENAPVRRERRSVGRFLADHLTALGVVVVGGLTVVALAVWLGIPPF